jgi:eukaryotic-like serine/threonine-protein kinase
VALRPPLTQAWRRTDCSVVGRLALPQIAGALEGLLAGLDHAAARGVVHRDLKPENVLVTGEGRVKIADFGIAKAVNRIWTAQYRTATGMTLGTPTYMAPEQAMGHEVSVRTDLYAVGVIAYEQLTGRGRRRRQRPACRRR